jgi:hypothetical protein
MMHREPWEDDRHCRPQGAASAVGELRRALSRTCVLLKAKPVYGAHPIARRTLHYPTSPSRAAHYRVLKIAAAINASPKSKPTQSPRFQSSAKTLP